MLESANNSKVHFGVWGVDPSVNFSLQYSLAENLVELSKSSYKLTKKGSDLINQIKKEDVLDGDYEYLQSLGYKITEKMVQNIVEEWK